MMLPRLAYKSPMTPASRLSWVGPAILHPKCFDLACNALSCKGNARLSRYNRGLRPMLTRKATN
jgi:hypothetical protein